MSKRVKVSELPEFDAAEYLNSEEEVAAYLTTVLEENDPALLAGFLHHAPAKPGKSRKAAASAQTPTRPAAKPAPKTAAKSAAKKVAPARRAKA